MTIEIKKINSTKRIYHFLIIVNGWHYRSDSNCFYRKKDAQKYIDNNKIKLEKLTNSLEYKKESPFDVPSELTMLIRKTNSYYNKRIFYNNKGENNE